MLCFCRLGTMLLLLLLTSVVVYFLTRRRSHLFQANFKITWEWGVSWNRWIRTQSILGWLTRLLTPRTAYRIIRMFQRLLISAFWQGTACGFLHLEELWRLLAISWKPNWAITNGQTRICCLAMMTNQRLNTSAVLLAVKQGSHRQLGLASVATLTGTEIGASSWFWKQARWWPVGTMSASSSSGTNEWES